MEWIHTEIYCRYVSLCSKPPGSNDRTTNFTMQHRNIQTRQKFTKTLVSIIHCSTVILCIMLADTQSNNPSLSDLCKLRDGTSSPTALLHPTMTVCNFPKGLRCSQCRGCHLQRSLNTDSPRILKISFKMSLHNFLPGLHPGSLSTSQDWSGFSGTCQDVLRNVADQDFKLSLQRRNKKSSLK